MHRVVYFDTSSRLLDLEQIASNRLLILQSIVIHIFNTSIYVSWKTLVDSCRFVLKSITLAWIWSLENFALHKSAWQLYIYENNYLRDYQNAFKAVDGLKTNLSFSGFQRTGSANHQTEAEWHVDFGAVLGINHITIYYRIDNVPWSKYHCEPCKNR